MVRLSVYDVAGHLVRTLVDESLAQGSHEAVWDGRDSSGREVASGSFMARLESGGKVETRGWRWSGDMAAIPLAGTSSTTTACAAWASGMRN